MRLEQWGEALFQTQLGKKGLRGLSCQAESEAELDLGKLAPRKSKLGLEKYVTARFACFHSIHAAGDCALS